MTPRGCTSSFSPRRSVPSAGRFPILPLPRAPLLLLVLLAVPGPSVASHVGGRVRIELRRHLVEPDRRRGSKLGVFAQRHRGRVHVALAARGGVVDADDVPSLVHVEGELFLQAGFGEASGGDVRDDVLVRARVEDVGGEANAVVKVVVDELGELGDEVVVRGVALEL